MIYATGGLAVTKLTVSNDYSDNTTLSGVGGISSNDTKTGWTVGAGIEFPLYQNLTLNGEYLYAKFGSIKQDSTIYNVAEGFGIGANSLVSPFDKSANLSANIVRVSLYYNFSGLFVQ